MTNDNLYRDGRVRPIEWNPGADKLKAFGWNEDVGAWSKPKMVPKENLRIDDRYQRDQTLARARKFAASFDREAFGRMVVSLRTNGQMFVVDGGHRLLAAMMRPDVSSVPCDVCEGLSLEDEAALFLKLNRDKRLPMGLQQWKALLRTGDPDALSLRDWCKAAGLDIGPNHKGGAVAAVIGLLKFMAKNGGRPAMAWAIDLSSCWEPDPARSQGHVLIGSAKFYKRFKDAHAEHALNGEAKTRFSRAGLLGLTSTANGLAHLERIPRAEAFSRALTAEWNKGRRSGKVVVSAAASS